jgi:hypothetical protein
MKEIRFVVFVEGVAPFYKAYSGEIEIVLAILLTDST